MSSFAEDLKSDARASEPVPIHRHLACWSIVISRGYTANLADKVARGEGKEPHHHHSPFELYMSVKQTRTPSAKDQQILTELITALGATSKEEFSIVGSRQFRWIDDVE